MRHIDESAPRYTSVTLQTNTKVALLQAVEQLNAHGIEFSAQRVMRECFRIALKLWRGRGPIADRTKTYNPCAGPCVIVPYYTTESMRSASWARCHHAGISHSRMMDFALRTYLPRVLEYWLSGVPHGRDKKDAAFWAARYARRLNGESFLISYKATEFRNDGIVLNYAEKTEIIPWPPPSRTADDIRRLIFPS